MAPFGIEAQHPDEFIAHLIDLSPGAVIAAAERHRESLKNPAKTIGEYLEMLEREGLTQTVSVLRDYMVRNKNFAALRSLERNGPSNKRDQRTLRRPVGGLVMGGQACACHAL